MILSFLRHHVKESGRAGVVVGMSGGLDSSVVAKLCADAIGRTRVLGLMMPGRTRNIKDEEDASAWATELGIPFRIVDVGKMVEKITRQLSAPLDDVVAIGNIAARSRMITLYHTSHVENRLVVGTGNKSEIATGYFCYDSETRALTPEGPKSFWELQPGQIVFSINLSTGEVDERPIQSVHVFDFDGDMLSIKTARLDLMVTPNHRMLIQRDHGRGSLAFESADSRLHGGHTTVPNPRPWRGLGSLPETIDTTVFLDGRRLSVNANPPVKMRREDFLYLMGLHIGDGSLISGKTRIPIKSHLTPRERWGIRNSKGQFDAIPGPGIGIKTYDAPRFAISSPIGDRSRGPLLNVLQTAGIHATTTSTEVKFTNRALWAAFSRCGSNAFDKCIPDWILKLPAAELWHLYRGLMDSDGSAGGSTYTTVSVRLAYQMVELCSKLGRHARVSWRHPKTTIYDGKEIRSSGSFDVGISQKAQTLGFRPHNMRFLSYRGKVWCPSVPPHENLLVERNGTTIFCGNTKFGDGGCDFAPIGDLYKTQVREMARHLGLPRAILEKVPTAGLWPGQTDEGELGIPYDELDRILLGIELQFQPEEIVERAEVDLKQVERVERLVESNVHKRKMPLIPKIGIRTFGLDWRE